MAKYRRFINDEPAIHLERALAAALLSEFRLAEKILSHLCGNHVERF